MMQGVEDTFDMLACYFPLVFTSPAGDPDAVSREALVCARRMSKSLFNERILTMQHRNKGACTWTGDCVTLPKNCVMLSIWVPKKGCVV